MNTIRKSLLIGMTVLGLGTAGFAAQADDTAGRGTHAAKMAEHQAKFAEHMAKRQAELHDKLKLTAAQEPAWTSFTAAMKPQAPMERPDHAAMAGLSAPERMEKHLEMARQHIAAQESRLAALKTFYATLSPEQKKTLDASMEWHGRGERGHRLMHRQHMMHQG